MARYNRLIWLRCLCYLGITIISGPLAGGEWWHPIAANALAVVIDLTSFVDARL